MLSLNNRHSAMEILMKRTGRNAVGCILFAAVILCAAVSAGAKTPFKLSGDDVVVFA